MTYIHKRKVTDKRNYFLKYKNIEKEDVVIRTHSKRVFLKHLRTIKFLKPFPRVYLRVSYGKHEDAFGIYQTFYNDGDYFSFIDLVTAFEAFDEK